jgi:signal transduction histidine kinase
VVHPDDMPNIIRIWTHSLSTGEPFDMEQRYKSAEGEYRWFNVRAIPMHDEEGNITQWVGSSTDIHESKLAIEQLADAQRELTTTNQRLQRSNVDLDNFVYVASHDLKAPAVNIDALVQTMREVMQNPAESEELPIILEMIQTSVSRFKQTLEDLSDIARMQRDAPEDVAEVPFDEAYAVALADLERLINLAHAKVYINFTEAQSVRFSRGGLRSVLYNLVSNAIKYRDPSRNPVVEVWTIATNEFTILNVKDNGLGMPERGREKVFSMFKRLHSHVEGSGVGLYIIKRAIENAGGTIELETEEGVGSHFRVFFKH